MCIKKTYTCYKGKETEDCCNSRVREAVRNRTYVLALILGIVLMIMALVIKTGNDTTFVNQVSFASTITSIILSVIAIWMSITGERSTNEIKTKVSDSVDKLLQTTNESDELVRNLRDVLSEQTKYYDNLISEVQGVKITVDSFMNSKGDKIETISNTFAIYQNVLDGIANKKIKRELHRIMIEVFSEMKNDPKQKMGHVFERVSRTSTENRDIIAGVITVLCHNGFFKDSDNLEKIKKIKIE